MKQPKVKEYRPPDFNETFGYPPDYAESTGIFECDSEGKSFLDSINDVNASFLGSQSMFGSSMLNSRNDMRNRVLDFCLFNPDSTVISAISHCDVVMTVMILPQ